MALIDINALYVAQGVAANDSKKGMVYTADNGDRFKVIVTENIGEALGFTDLTTADLLLPTLPQGFSMRTVSFSDATGRVKGQYPVGVPTAPIFSEGGTITVVRKGSVSGVVCTVTGTQGEKRRIISAEDTGQDSGDVT